MHLPASLNSEGQSASKDVEVVGNFELQERVAVEQTDVVVTKWRSRETGLRVVHVDYEGPIINGYFAVATETFDDRGCPHTLEHLVFKGSEQFPYSDALPRLVARSFSSTAEAYTDQDTTVYTLSTAGSASFLQLLPVYVDHILYPLLTPSAFVTEVFHINEEGQDAGVVYSELQGRQNKAGDLIDLAYQRKLYPERSGYRSRTGGLMEALRTLDLEEIKQYHTEYYVPHNICLIVTGRVATTELLETIQKTVEATALKHGQVLSNRAKDWKRPFMETESAKAPILSSNSSIRVEFPAKEECFGEITVITIDPSPDDHLVHAALNILDDYLTGTIVSPLNKKLVDIQSPYCTSIDFGHQLGSSFRERRITLSDVPIRYMEGLEVKLKKTIRKIMDQGIDMERLHDILDREAILWRRRREEGGGDAFSDDALCDFLYGNEKESCLEKSLQDPEIFTSLKAWKVTDWINVLDRLVMSPNMLVVRAYPSATMSERLEREEKKRVEEQVARLGPDGLEKQERIVREAKQRNENPMPDELLEKIPVPDVNTIDWIAVQSASTRAQSHLLQPHEVRSDPLARHLATDPASLPFVLHFDHVSSEFVEVNIYMSVASIPEDRKHLVYIFDQMFFLSFVTLEDGTILSHKELIHQLEKDVVYYSFGESDNFPELFCLSLTVEASKYNIAVRWMRRLLWSSEIIVEKLQNCIARIKQSLPEDLRGASSALGDLEVEEMYTDKYTGKVSSARQIIKWIPEFERRLKRDPKGIVTDLGLIRAELLKPGGLRFSVLGDVMKLKRPRSAWDILVPHVKFAEVEPILQSCETLSELGKNPRQKAIIISLSGVESSFCTHLSTGPSGWTHEDSAKLHVTLELLCGEELYFWKRIRGTGLAYGASAGHNVQAGILAFEVWRSPNVVKAYQEAKAVVQGLVDGTVPLEKLKLEAAKTGATYEFAECVSTRSSMVSFVFVNRVLRGRPTTWLHDRLAAMAAVTESDVLLMLKKYVLPLFQAETSVALVACGPGQAEMIARGYRQEGFDVEIRQMDDKVPWSDEENNLSAKATKALDRATRVGKSLVQSARRLLHP